MPRLGDLDLGALPRIAVAVTDRDLAAPSWVALADVVEVRLDQCTRRSPDDAADICRAARRLGRPLLATVRSAAEGGAATDDDARRAVFAAVAPLVDGLDVEMASPSCDEIVALARRHGGLALVSRHDFATTPPDAALRATLAEGGRRGDVVKLAATPTGPADLARLVDLQRVPGPARIVIAMGTEGAASRVFLPLLGSLLTYSFVGAPTAPGQLPLRELYDALRRYSPAFAAAHPAR